MYLGWKLLNRIGIVTKNRGVNKWGYFVDPDNTDQIATAKLGYGIMQVRTGVCKCFSDKSEWFHFPIKDYKTAYYVVGYGDDAGVIAEPICGWGVKNGRPSIIDAYGDLYGIDTEVFLTKKDAEKEVERRKH